MKFVNSPTHETLDTIEREYALELADTLAWTIAVGNILGIDCEAVVLDRYGDGCWRCKKNSCVCTNFNVDPLRL